MLISLHALHELHWQRCFHSESLFLKLNGCSVFLRVSGIMFHKLLPLNFREFNPKCVVLTWEFLIVWLILNEYPWVFVSTRECSWCLIPHVSFRDAWTGCSWCLLGMNDAWLDASRVVMMPGLIGNHKKINGKSRSHVSVQLMVW